MKISQLHKVNNDIIFRNGGSILLVLCMKLFMTSLACKIVISELDERMQDLRTELQSFEGDEFDESHKIKAVNALKRMENWNLFTDTSEVYHLGYTIALISLCNSGGYLKTVRHCSSAR